MNSLSFVTGGSPIKIQAQFFANSAYKTLPKIEKAEQWVLAGLDSAI
jgi:hypothetical protein